MCGIFGLFDAECEYHKARKLVCSLVKKIRHRGPDDNGIVLKESMKRKGVYNAVCHERLAIIDPLAQKQPIFGSTEAIVTSTNVEIYNHELIRSSMYGKYKILDENTCDVFVIPFLYEELEKDVEGLCNQFFAARDHAGICPSYIGKGKNGETIISSEIKALNEYCSDIRPVPPGHYYDSKTKMFYRWYKPKWVVGDLSIIKEAFIDSLRQRLMCDVQFGVWLNGTIESSITAAVTNKLLKEMNYNPNFSKNNVLNSFAIGFGKSKALDNSKKVSKYLGTAHHEIIFLPEEGTDVIEDVIYHLETYNPIDVRKGIEYYLLSKKIKSMGFKMALNGDGADELFGTNIEVKDESDKKEIGNQFIQKYYELSLTDLTMSNKASMAWGLEIRVPFVERDYINLIMNSDPSERIISKSRNRISKHILREAFDDKESEMLPSEIIWDPESDYQTDPNLLEAIEKLASIEITDNDFEKRKIAFPDKTPTNKEEFYYRSIYEKNFKIKDTFSPFTSPKKKNLN